MARRRRPLAPSTRAKLRTLFRLRDLLCAVSLRRWHRDGWTVKTHLDCASVGRHRRPDGNAPLAVIQDDDHENVVHLYPHPAERDQPIEKTMVHEVLGHIGLGLEDSVSDERIANRLEDLLWPILTPSQRRALHNLIG